MVQMLVRGNLQCIVFGLGTCEQSGKATLWCETDVALSRTLQQPFQHQQAHTAYHWRTRLLADEAAMGANY